MTRTRRLRQSDQGLLQRRAGGIAPEFPLRRAAACASNLSGDR